jgi:2-polyprenyl-3-methyl-5-hydroxy-6-metoxy-1,4-benzoquinol methylase
MDWKSRLKGKLYFWLRPCLDGAHRWLEGGLPNGGEAQTPIAQCNQGTRYIANLADLDVELREVEKAFQISDDEARRRMAEFQYVLNEDFPAEPDSTEYAAAQMRMYLALSGRTVYDASTDERSHFDPEQAKHKPFPYLTQSPSTVGDQLIAQGFLIRTMDLKPGARIVEFGPGWGNTTMHLAQMGYRVTAVEVEENFVELIRLRAMALGVDVQLVHQDMASFEPSEQYDSALFFESFHHCADHLRLLGNLYQMVVPDGSVFFASEPIAEFPHPWGFVRTDGMTLWSIRKWGWFELGFDTSYFLRTLLHHGWSPRCHSDDVSPLTNVIAARKSHGYYSPSELSLPPDEAATWGLSEPGLRFITNRSVISCQRQDNIKSVEICLSNFAPEQRQVTLAAGRTTSQHMVSARTEETILRIHPDSWQGQLIIMGHNANRTPVPVTGNGKALGLAVHWLRLVQE